MKNYRVISPLLAARKTVLTEAKVWAGRIIEATVCVGAVALGVVMLSCITAPPTTDATARQAEPAEQHQTIESAAQVAPQRTVALKPSVALQAQIARLARTAAK